MKIQKNIPISHGMTFEEKKIWENIKREKWWKMKKDFSGKMWENSEGLTNDKSYIIWCNECSHFCPNE